jgi:cation diffusion facilitator CzcD-associated flavoprotein CzcO
MNFAMNPDWPRFFSYSPDIHKYLCKIADVFDLRKLMHFNHKVIEARWNEDKGRWVVKMEKTKPDGSVESFEDEGDLLLYGTGILNDFKWPDIKGIEKFKGKLVHTARWPENYQAEQWKDDKVAVIGSGASSIQTVPNMINRGVKHMDVFVRTGVWFVEIANNFGANHEYTDEQKEAFRSDPKNIVEHAKSIEQQVNGLWGIFYDKAEGQLMAQDMLRQRMGEFIKDERLLKGFTPKFAVGCRRITPGDPYMKAIQEPNVDVHFTHVTEITEDGLIGADGIERKVDTIVCATGFDVTYKPRFPVIGKNGVNLQEKWAVAPEGYLGLGVPDMPNFIMMIGPTWPVENGAVVGPLLGVSEYMIQIVKKMQKDDIKSWTPKQDVTDAFNEHAQEWVKHTVWKDDCRSW